MSYAFILASPISTNTTWPAKFAHCSQEVLEHGIHKCTHPCLAVDAGMSHNAPANQFVMTFERCQQRWSNKSVARTVYMPQGVYKRDRIPPSFDCTEPSAKDSLVIDSGDRVTKTLSRYRNALVFERRLHPNFAHIRSPVLFQLHDNIH